MLLPMRHEDVTTCQSRDHYASLAQRTPELPDTLDELLELLHAKDVDSQLSRARLIAPLVKAIQDQADEWSSVQLWLVWAFRPVIIALSVKFKSRLRKKEEVAHDAMWCLLEALQSVGTDTDYLPRDIARRTRQLLRRHYGLEAETEIPEHVGLDDLLDGGWDVPTPEALTLIKDLQLPTADEDLLSGQFLYGFSPAELAEQLGITPAALRQRMHRILVRLRRKS